MSSPPLWGWLFVCDALVEIRAPVARYALGFNASLLSGADAGVVMEVAGAVEAMAAVVKALAGVRAGECGTWKEAGDRSAAHHLARRSGMSVGLATEALATARRLSGLALLSASARSGALSAPQVAAVALAAEALAELARGEEAEARPSGAGPAGGGPIGGGPAGSGSGPAPARRGRSRPKVIARVDLLALLRGRPVKGECASWPASARWRPRPSAISSTPPIPSSLRW